MRARPLAALLAAALAACGTAGTRCEAGACDAEVRDALDASDLGVDARGRDAEAGTADGEAGCPARGTSENTPGTELFVGTGRDGTIDDYRPLAPGDPVFVAPGEQGLQHVIMALRGRGYDPALPLLTARLLRVSDCEQVGYLRFRLPFRPDPADPSRLAVEALRVVLQDDLDPLEFCTVLGRDVTLVVDLDDLAGKTAHRELRLHVAGIDPATRSDVRDAYLEACARRPTGDGGTAPIDGSLADSSRDGSRADSTPADAPSGDALMSID